MALRLDHYPLLEKLPKPGSKKDRYRNYRSKVPAGEKGKWRVCKFTIEVGLELLRLMRDGRGTPPGEYTSLVHGGATIMSDTDAELDDLQEMFRRANQGNVLIHGLGLGIVLQGVLAHSDVTSVEVVEIDKDVIDLIGPHFTDKRVTIHHADCRFKEWPKGSAWDFVWHDIWPNICGDNLDEIKALKRKFARKCTWQGVWAESLVRQFARY